ncbi:LysR substrate-binding domain-containing protein [Stenotrophomonas sp. 24(2023)]|uniref:LysR family transcriptional regulator n=1 Tax=Stenotrophomonas sp. 24(2023) TaxID=3068324 RepID=UPI0027E09BC3|nr:LysR substrate-binding domain-containing protein [Stenotrophomonas sp. 24(2023)]WMJ68245.1 LysR substrate-binding domain-containing protein [Stenotrophomonas sp. 24(2023)]
MSHRPALLPSDPLPDPLAHGFATHYTGVVAFLAVAREGSFAQAGRRLGIGRSAVSRQVQKLEDQLGARLFLRTTRRTALTREGERFHAQCQPGIASIVQAMDELRALRQGPPRGTVRIQASTGFGRAVLAPLLAGFHAQYPQVVLDLQLDDRAAAFERDRVDIAFHDGVLADSPLIARPVLPMALHLCAAPAYAAGHGLPRTLAELASHAAVHHRLPDGQWQAWTLQAGGQLQRLLPPAACVFNDSTLVLEAVLAGQGLAQLPACLAGPWLRSGQLIACLPACMPAPQQHWLCYPSRQHLPARTRAFIDYIVPRLRALDAPPAPVAAAA